MVYDKELCFHRCPPRNDFKILVQFVFFSFPACSFKSNQVYVSNQKNQIRLTPNLVFEMERVKLSQL